MKGEKLAKFFVSYEEKQGITVYKDAVRNYLWGSRQDKKACKILLGALKGNNPMTIDEILCSLDVNQQDLMLSDEEWKKIGNNIQHVLSGLCGDGKIEDDVEEEKSYGKHVTITFHIYTPETKYCLK